MSSNPYYSNNYTPEQHQSLINFIISLLEAPIDPTIVSKHYSNDRNIATEIQAYAKISGKDWTYYVKNLEIVTGRDTESKFDILPTPTSMQENKDHIDIDLGPAKVVSRKHAVIKYNIQLGCWELHVIGRNGAKVNFHRIHGNPASPVPLRSGTILDIGGTQMIFILPDQVPILSESALDHMMPKLIGLFGVEPNTNNPLINDLIKNSSLALQEKERLKFEQTLKQNSNSVTNLNNTQQLVSNNGKLNNINNNNNDANINNNHNININHNSNSNNANNQEFRIFKMYSSIQSAANVANSISTNITNNGPTSNNSYNQFMNTGIQSTGNTPVYNELSGPTTIVNGEFSYNVVSQSSSEANMKRITTLAQNGFPHAMDYVTDLSLDENRTVKPPHSYATMITQAILSSKDGVISLSDIYRFISTNYSYYRYAKTGWQNSIRHNLSLNKAFEKVPRKPNEPGKGMKWRVSEKFQKDFLNAWYTGNLSKIKRGSSVFRQLQMHMAKYNKLPGRDEEGNVISSDDNSTNNNQSQAPLPSSSTSSSSQINQNNMNMDNNNSTGSAVNHRQHIMQLNFNNGTNSNDAMKQETANIKVIPPQYTSMDNTNRDVKDNNSNSNDAPVIFANMSHPSSVTNQQMSQQTNKITLPKLGANTNSTMSSGVNTNNTSKAQSSVPHSASSSISTHSSIITQSDGGRDFKNNSISSGPINQSSSNNNNNNNNNSNSSSSSSATITRGLASNTITTSASGNNKLDPSISSGYDTLLISPTKTFHITAMEAYTPERGSTMNQQMDKSPEHKANPSSSSSSSSSSTKDNSAAGTGSATATTATTSNDNNTTNNANMSVKSDKKQTNSLSSNKSSPGVWNLLQFSSAANTPAIPSINSKEDNELRIGTSSPGMPSAVTGTTTTTTTTTTTASTTTGETKNDAATTPISAVSSMDSKRNLILDTENAKITTVNN